MATEYWEAGDSIREIMQRLMANYHPDLADIEDRVALLFKDKSGKSGGVVIPGKTKKASALLSVLGKKDYVFVLEIGYDVWSEYSESEKVAELDHLLCRCGVSYNEEAGEYSYFLRVPEVAFFPEELRRYGVWRKMEDMEQEDLLAIATVEDLFYGNEGDRQKKKTEALDLWAKKNDITGDALDSLRTLVLG